VRTPGLVSREIIVRQPFSKRLPIAGRSGAGAPGSDAHCLSASLASSIPRETNRNSPFGSRSRLSELEGCALPCRAFRPALIHGVVPPGEGSVIFGEQHNVPAGRPGHDLRSNKPGRVQATTPKQAPQVRPEPVLIMAKAVRQGENAADSLFLGIRHASVHPPGSDTAPPSRTAVGPERAQACHAEREDGSWSPVPRCPLDQIVRQSYYFAVLFEVIHRS
jgi:hypothetical protein